MKPRILKSHTFFLPFTFSFLFRSSSIDVRELGSKSSDAIYELLSILHSFFFLCIANRFSLLISLIFSESATKR